MNFEIGDMVKLDPERLISDDLKDMQGKVTEVRDTDILNMSVEWEGDLVPTNDKTADHSDCYLIRA